MKIGHKLLLLRQWCRIHAALRLSKNPLVIVYQMGRVGSQATRNSIKLYTKAPVFHVHKMNPYNLARRRKDNRNDHQELHKTYIGKMLHKHIVAKQRKAMFIVLIREPISRNISAFFYNRFVHGGCKEDQDKQVYPSVAELRATFLETHYHAKPLIWFDAEMKGALGIDVYQYPFPREKGYLCIEHGNFKILVIKCELADSLKEGAIAEFLGLNHFKLSRDNAAQDKNYIDLYKNFIETIQLPSDYVEKMYSSKYAKHFYTDAEREQMRSRWIG